jgi:hypothetical protein
LGCLLDLGKALIFSLLLGGGGAVCFLQEGKRPLEADLRQRMQKAVRHLLATADVLAELLIKIMEIKEEDDGMEC